MLCLQDKIRPGRNSRDEGFSGIEHAMAGLRAKTQSFQDNYDMHKDEALNLSFQVQYETWNKLEAMDAKLKDYCAKQYEIFRRIEPTVNLFALLSERFLAKDRTQCMV